ncbi:chromatin-binding transcription regulator [Starmerella bacillaris]|uniref:Transcriptional adapter 2 n=1 Tax=Starmerella bacillaris TaxID=1247836 RepID=A0AAV5RIQ4_STABA|nr:chromatin-binding transcription regulator [Starmerella bacillaris]
MGKSDGFEIMCDCCGTDLSNLVSIRCAECTDEEYDTCVPCFAKGASSKNHKPYHDYIVIEQQAYPIFTNDWGADEELLMIEGLEQFGVGSWEDIADHIGRRSKEDVEKHYKMVYLESPNYPMPYIVDRPLLDDMSEFMERRRKRLEKYNAHQQLLRSDPQQKGTKDQQGALASVPACHEIQGYMPGRLEFETEAENDAEMVIKNLLFEPDDNDFDVEQKLTVLSIYNSRLERRTERKRTILAHNLLDYRKLIATEKKRTKEEKELYNKLKPFVRVLPADEFQKFTEDILAEQSYRHRIAELQEYRQNGIKTLDEAKKYEKDKQVRHSAIFRTSQPPIPQRYSYFEQLVNEQHSISNMHANTNNISSSLTSDGSSTPNVVINDEEPMLMKVKKMSGIAPLDVAHAPDVDLLSPEEKLLCTQLRIVPKSYLAIKQGIIQAGIRNHSVSQRKLVRELFPHIDDQRISRIYDFFVAQNWIA